ncbi:MAG: KH domain-containing protein [Nanoarchaeota archaeon]|nr:KH domain-containing protein [Nanoarchaeota archaeon]MBU1623007.1 KH domain-containing protein [Nanoarchaeota archaeon]MBU1974415.1 KH domain-containing protein [Nanoarchaeota archaeon]
MAKDNENHDNLEAVPEEEYAYEIKIPEERVAVLIGKDGETKKEIEEETKSKLDISKEGDVEIKGSDGMLLYTTKEIVKAIARGFNPKTALLLLKQDYAFELIEMKDLAGKSKNTLQRLKGRVIGKGGKAREEIERLTDCNISVYGKTIGIIGETQQVSLARQAVAMLLQGSMHKTVFNFLEKKKKEMMFG